MAAARAEAGTAVVIALALVVVLVAVGIAAVDTGLLVVARGRAQAAADLAALASLTGSVTPPRQLAGEVAAANGARLTGCTCGAVESVVSVEHDVRLLPAGQVVRVRADARAVLPVTPLYPFGLP